MQYVDNQRITFKLNNILLNLVERKCTVNVNKNTGMLHESLHKKQKQLKILPVVKDLEKKFVVWQ